MINLQGDEPLINSNSLKLMIKKLESLSQNSEEIISGISYVNSEQALIQMLVNVLSLDLSIQYFSENPFEFSRKVDNLPYLKQLGLYGMTKKTLMRFPLYLRVI